MLSMRPTTSANTSTLTLSAPEAEVIHAIAACDHATTGRPTWVSQRRLPSIHAPKLQPALVRLLPNPVAAGMLDHTLRAHRYNEVPDWRISDHSQSYIDKRPAWLDQ